MRSDGTLFTARTLWPLGSGSTLREFVQWQWTGPLTMGFTSVAAQYPLSNDQSRVFRELCDAIMGNFPAILSRPPPANNIRLTNDVERRDVQALREPDGADTLFSQLSAGEHFCCPETSESRPTSTGTSQRRMDKA
jgi:hypothetical protein